MNIYQLSILVLIVIILVHELVPATTQSVLKRAMKRCRKRARDLRGFIDDDDYNVSPEFRQCPFTLDEYLSTQTLHTPERQRAREESLRAHGWGSLTRNGPDVIQPGTHWWQEGECILRDVPLDAHVLHMRKRHEAHSSSVLSPPPPPATL